MKEEQRAMSVQNDTWVEIGVTHFLNPSPLLALCIVFYILNPITTLCGRYYPHFTDEEIET